MSRHTYDVRAIVSSGRERAGGLGVTSSAAVGPTTAVTVTARIYTVVITLYVVVMCFAVRAYFRRERQTDAVLHVRTDDVGGPLQVAAAMNRRRACARPSSRFSVLPVRPTVVYK